MYDRLDRHFCPPNVYSFPSQAVAAIIATVLCPDLCILELLVDLHFFFLKDVKILCIQKATINLKQVFSFVGRLSLCYISEYLGNVQFSHVSCKV